VTTQTQDKSSPPEANGNGPEKRSLAQKLLAVATSIEDIDLDGKNDHFKYEYATAANILRHVRKPLADEGVLLLTSLESIEERSKGNSTVTTVRVRFMFVDTDANVYPQEQHDKIRPEPQGIFTAFWAGQGDDPSDKGLAKAYTSAIKTFLRETFLLPLGDDPEADTRADKRSEGDSSPQLPADEKLPPEFVKMLGEKVDKAGLSQHLPMKLRSFGVVAITDLTVEQGRVLWAWSENPDG
jgi:hypothetical protein